MTHYLGCFGYEIYDDTCANVYYRNAFGLAGKFAEILFKSELKHFAKPIKIMWLIKQTMTL